MTAMFRRTLAATCVALGLLATVPMAHAAESTTTVLSVAAKMPELSTFVRLVQQAGLTATLEGEVTAFAPTDDAFKAVPAATLDKLAKDPELLKAVLSYHVLPGKIKAASIEANTAVTTLQGGKVSVSRAGDFVTVDDGMVINADIAAGNGVIHEIDRVLMPTIKK